MEIVTAFTIFVLAIFVGIEIIRAQRHPHPSLFDQRRHRMLDLPGVPMIHETPGEEYQHMRPLFDFSQQQSATV